MFQKLEPKQLQELSYDDLVAHKTEAEEFKAKLEAAKAKGGKAWTVTAQEKLDDLVVYIVDLDDAAEEKKPKTEEAKVVEKPKVLPKGWANHVVLKVVRGRRFNPMTGTEESQPYQQIFSFAEWQNFKKHHASLGYTIVEVLNDPWGDAAAFVEPKKEA